LIFGRNDNVGCPVFSPIDEAEARLNARRSAGGRPRQRAVSSPENT
jgi:hypothetical protein